MEPEESEWINNLADDEIKKIIDYSKELSKGVTQTVNSRNSMKYFHHRNQTNLHYLIFDSSTEYFWLVRKIYEVFPLDSNWSPEDCLSALKYLNTKDEAKLHYLIHDIANEYFWIITEIYHTWPFDPEWRIYDPTMQNN